MIKSILCRAFLILLGSFSLSHARDVNKEQNCNPNTILLIADTLKLKAIEEGDSEKNPWLVSGLEGVQSAACKIAPQNKNLMYVALASNPTDNNNYGEATYDFTIAILDIKKNIVISSYKDKMEEDAAFRLGKSNLRIDTANYRLNDKTRAFGIDLISDYIPNCGDGGFGNIRTLYIEEGKKIRPILSGLIMSDWRYLVEGASRCNSEISDSVIPIIKESNITISIAETMTNGFKDLIINRTTNVKDVDGNEILKDNKVVKENLYKDESLAPYSYKINYSGREYPNK